MKNLLDEYESRSCTSGTEVKRTLRRVIDMGLFKALVGGTIGLAVGAMTCAPISGMVGGAFIAQDWE